MQRFFCHKHDESDVGWVGGCTSYFSFEKAAFCYECNEITVQNRILKKRVLVAQTMLNGTSTQQNVK